MGANAAAGACAHILIIYLKYRAELAPRLAAFCPIEPSCYYEASSACQNVRSTGGVALISRGILVRFTGTSLILYSAGGQTAQRLRLQTVEHEVTLALPRLAGRQELARAEGGDARVVIADPAAAGQIGNRHVSRRVARLQDCATLTHIT